jgi:hypothetical protein
LLALNTNINNPYSIRCDTIGNIYYNDLNNYRIRKIDITTRLVNTIAGNGVNGYNGDNIAATNAQISYYMYLTVDFNGNVYFCDNNRIRKIDFTNSFYLFFIFTIFLLFIIFIF